MGCQVEVLPLLLLLFLLQIYVYRIQDTFSTKQFCQGDKFQGKGFPSEEFGNITKSWQQPRGHGMVKLPPEVPLAGFEFRGQSANIMA